MASDVEHRMTKSTPPGLSGDRESSHLVAAWVSTGLRVAGERTMRQLPPIFAALDAHEELRPWLEDASADGWSGLSRRVVARLRELDGRFARLLDDERLSVHELFLFCLAGRVEDDHLIHIALTALQAPEGGIRPRVHLALRLLEVLFELNDANVRDLQSCSLAKAGILKMLGDAPAPLRELAVHPSLWALLNGGDATWDACRWLDGDALVPRGVVEGLPPIITALEARAARGMLVRGLHRSGRRALAAQVARALGRRAIEVPAATWQDEPAFAAACRVGGWLPVIAPRLRVGDVHRVETGRRDDVPIIVVLSFDGALEEADIVEMFVEPPSLDERRVMWSARLGDDAPNELVETAAAAVLSGPMIDDVARAARIHADEQLCTLDASHLARARRQVGTDELRLLAHPVVRHVDDAALVVPPPVASGLAALRARCLNREALWTGLGPTLAATANAGVRALFVGESGTGKTLAASWLATTLHAPLYRVDLAAVMNKYVGESEKLLGRLLDLALASDVVLLFDEADALFGQRSSASETGERYANMLTNFLLTRIEAHRGIVVLTANSRSGIDRAFVRRLDVVLEFPPPGHVERVALWHSHLGSRAPAATEVERLAAWCDLPGGNVRNVVLAAAVAAPDGPFALDALLAALAGEYRKLGRGAPPALFPSDALEGR